MIRDKKCEEPAPTSPLKVRGYHGKGVRAADTKGGGALYERRINIVQHVLLGQTKKSM